MRKKISLVAVITLIAVCLVSSLMGCQTPVSLEEGLADLQECIVFTDGLQEYEIKVIEITPDANPMNTKTKETITNVHLDNEKTKGVVDPLARVSVKEKDVYGKGPYKSIAWGDSLKEGVKAKKATEADYKRGAIVEVIDKGRQQKDKNGNPAVDKEGNPIMINGVKVHGTGKKLADFVEFIPDGYSILDVMAKLQAFLETDIGKNPDSIMRQGRVTVYEYKDITAANTSIFGDMAVTDDGKYPLRIETVHSAKDGKGYVSSISDKEQDGKLRIFITMKGPVVNIPSWYEE